jgi:hypothetical protein|tara:strand:+ start:1980 stop:2459 length:480 start_codon:yes stop_codon:yes gene_type:complete
MIKVDITQEMRDKAKEMSSEMGTIKGSFMKGQGNIYGFLGELCFLEVMKDAEHKNTYEYDLVLSDGKTLDVKTKKTTVEPKPNYECSVSTWNLKQECDLYGFARVHKDMDVGWVLGVMDKESFLKDGTHYNKGDYDPSNRYTVKSECYSVAIEDLKSIN